MRHTILATIALLTALYLPAWPQNLPLKPRSESMAYGLAAAATAVPLVAGALLVNHSNEAVITTGGFLMVSGALLGPSFGQYYAGSAGHGIGATGVRVLGTVLLAVGGFASRPSISCLEREPGDECKDKGPSPLMILGGATYIGGVLYSLGQTHSAVRKRNTSAAASLQWGPTFALDRSKSLQSGASLALSF